MAKDRAHDSRRVAKVVTGGMMHTVYEKNGDIIVDHAGKNDPKWDKINLTDKAGAKTVEEGVQDVRDWHRKENQKHKGAK